MSMEGIVMRALFNNHSKELGRAETRIGRDEEYWLEVDEYREGMPAIDHVRFLNQFHFNILYKLFCIFV